MYIRNFTGYYHDKAHRIRVSCYNFIKITSRSTFSSQLRAWPLDLPSLGDPVIYSGSKEGKKSHLATEAPRRRLPLRVRSAGRVGRIAIYGTAPPLNSFKLDIDGGG